MAPVVLDNKGRAGIGPARETVLGLVSALTSAIISGRSLAALAFSDLTSTLTSVLISRLGSKRGGSPPISILGLSSRSGASGSFLMGSTFIRLAGKLVEVV